ncbi:hypothetical protein [uncultured Paracoccus sp.]|uniref:RcgA family putative transporter n=1 Tax=uncultured Paracoccus sp. TaxID=189685 RepID=UPI00261A0E6A|nr:hypothetical protein [uncultured Paracoccus sp.]
MFKRAAAAGAGRPVTKDGFPAGPWTPELLAEAISEIDANRVGVDLRTVQLWFQENERGISPANIRWLARVMGCDDPVATSEWQIELMAAQSRLTAQRRQKRRNGRGNESTGGHDTVNTAPVDHEAETFPTPVLDSGASEQRRWLSLATRSEEIFSRGSPLDFPSSVFAGAVVLGFLSYLLNIHNIYYASDSEVIKQVGFLWAPNWTLLFMIFMPLFFAFVSDLLNYWKNDARPQLIDTLGKDLSIISWPRKVNASSHTYWIVLIVCIVFAGVFQWVGVRLIPLLSGVKEYAPDWGSLAIYRPDEISVMGEIIFTGLAYLYMCICFYLFFAGLILLYTLAHDFWEIGEAIMRILNIENIRVVHEAGLQVMRGIFRCTMLGVLIAICMKLQSAYLTSSDKNIIIWLIEDMSSTVYGRGETRGGSDYSMPTHYSSLLVALSSGVVFLYASVRLGSARWLSVALGPMMGGLAFLGAGYLLIGVLPGFSIVLGLGALLAIYGLFDPSFGRRRSIDLGGSQGVS